MARKSDLKSDEKRSLRLGRRGFLTALGAGGLTTAGTVFGFATPASALVHYQCCRLCCNPSHSLSQCETGSHYVWECTTSGGYLYCNCCEHGNPCLNCGTRTPCPNCNSSNYSSAQCQYP